MSHVTCGKIYNLPKRSVSRVKQKSIIHATKLYCQSFLYMHTNIQHARIAIQPVKSQRGIILLTHPTKYCFFIPHCTSLHVPAPTEVQSMFTLPASYSNPKSSHRTLSDLQLHANKLGISLGRERLGPLNWGTDGTVNDQLWKDTKSSGNTKEDG